MQSTSPSSGQFEVFFTDPLYLTYKNFLYNFLVRRFVIRKELGKVNVGRILELGCGISPMLEPNARTVQTDISLNALKHLVSQSRERHVYRSVNCDGVRLPFLSESFDFIVCSEVIEHVQEDEKLLIEIIRILKKEGKLLLTCPVHRKYFGFDDQFVGHFRRYEIGPMQERLSRLGMREIHVIPLLGSLEKTIMDKVTRVFAATKREKQTGFGTLARLCAFVALPLYIVLNGFLAALIYLQGRLSSLETVTTVCFQCQKG